MINIKLIHLIIKIKLINIDRDKIVKNKRGQNLYVPVIQQI